MRGLYPRRQTPHPYECVSTSGDALSHKGRGRSNLQPNQFATYTSGSALELGFLKALRKAGDIGTL
ncbi:hypothetical protein CVM73_09895 [Bradyrhizobium forestalis]|uniref:Uncharacterized protein n=1 Tax=Bradyrhizobium forestalis TaxID=1419263 RepID=A0A2M8RC50_9BRAD|nr:hypothetical protein CVM73_09895 [Bradyrhizobium forestalis]